MKNRRTTWFESRISDVAAFRAVTFPLAAQPPKLISTSFEQNSAAAESIGREHKVRRKPKMFNPISELQAVEYRKRELIREAKLQHLVRKSQQERVKTHERFLALVGDLMISGGSKLKARYDAANQSLRSHPHYEIKPQNS
jgi:hypothetical protein